MAEKIDYSKGIYDAKQLGTPKLLILGAQHMFAMFGATVLVPLLTGLSVSTTLLCAGLGTLLFHFLCKGKVPAFLGSSFAYLGGFTIVTNGGANPENLPYACAAVALSGLVYVLFRAPSMAAADRGWSARLTPDQVPAQCRMAQEDSTI